MISELKYRVALALLAVATLAAGGAGLYALVQHRALQRCEVVATDLRRQLGEANGALDLQSSQVASLASKAAAAQAAASEAMARADAADSARKGQVAELKAKILAGKQTACAPAVDEIRAMLRGGAQ